MYDYSSYSNYGSTSGLGALFAGMGVLLFVLVAVSIAAYVWTALEYSKVLKALGYKNPWMAWIPLANMYALADVIRGDDTETVVWGKSVPAMLFNFWWAISMVCCFIPGIGTVLYTVLRVVCLGNCFAYIYAAVEGKEVDEVKGIAIASGFIPIIALIKFTQYKFE